MSEMNIELGVVPEKECKIVSEPSIARKLLKDGFKIVDIKPKKGAARESIFVFGVEGNFMETLAKYIEERKEKKREMKQGKAE